MENQINSILLPITLPLSQIPSLAALSKQKKRSLKRALDQRGKNTGHWTPSENVLYRQFLETHARNFSEKTNRRKDKIFKEMSNILGTRSAEQCRSHHQKMERKYPTLQQLLEALNQGCQNTSCQARMSSESSNKSAEETSTCSQTSHQIEVHNIGAKVSQPHIESIFREDQGTGEEDDVFQLINPDSGVFSEQCAINQYFAF